LKKDSTTHQRRPIQLRLELIDELLNSNTNRNYKIFLDALNGVLEIKGELGISERTLKYDIAHLIDKKEAPIHRPTKADPNLYYTRKFSIKDLLISEEEVGFLRRAIDILKQVDNFQIVGDVELIIQKLENRVNTFSKEPATEFIQFEKQPLLKGAQYLDNLLDAIKAKSTIKINYHPFIFSESSEFVAFPYLLKEYRNRWFLFARKSGDNKITTYALDRIVSIKNSAVPYETTSSFDPISYFKHLIGVSLPYDCHPEKIILKVYNSCTPYIKTKKLHDSQEIIREYSDGSMLIELFVFINYELKSLLQGYGPEIEVKKPEGLRQQIKELLRTNIKHYLKAAK